jgi:hypothetical protein
MIRFTSGFFRGWCSRKIDVGVYASYSQCMHTDEQNIELWNIINTYQYSVSLLYLSWKYIYELMVRTYYETSFQI